MNEILEYIPSYQVRSGPTNLAQASGTAFFAVMAVTISRQTRGKLPAVRFDGAGLTSVAVAVNPQAVVRTWSRST